MSDPNIGRLLAKRYQIQKLIGTGAMGRVYRAKDMLLGGVPVAVKFLALSMQNQQMRMKERFEREAKTCALLGQRSIHVVRVMDYGVDENDIPFYVMEYLKGKSLSQIIRNETLSLKRFLNIAHQICLGLGCAHDGITIDDVVCPIIHRDIKPSNIFILQDPSFGELVKILDFGIAKLLQSNTENTNYYLGTLAYSSPEQMEGKELDNRSDIYSLGVMMFEMLTGRMPIQTKTHSFGAWYKAHREQKPRSFTEINSTIPLPSSLEALIMDCLGKSPCDRPQNITEIIETLGKLETLEKTNHSLQNFASEQKFLPEDDIPEKTTLKAELTQPTHSTDSDLPPSVIKDEIARSCFWPTNKPIANIVFPQAIKVNSKLLPALWAMLPILEIRKFFVCSRYNQFIFITEPHPMLLWISAIYNQKHGAKWLNCYLDLKTKFGRETTRLLGENGYYQILLFAKEAPQPAHLILNSSIASAQTLRLQEWVKLSYSLCSKGNPQLSKKLLQNEYEKMKPQILEKLTRSDIQSGLDINR